jgi:DNA primase
VEFLARRWGVPPPTTRRPAGSDPLERQLALNEAALAFFRRSLGEDAGGRSCRRYLEQRGVSDAVEAKLGLGFAPDSWEALLSHLKSKRFAVDEILKAGLAVPRKEGTGQYDRFRNRLIFPIRDVHGRTVAFGGRALADAEAKYINSPETPTYRKGEHLYGLDLAREAIRRSGVAVVVEGYLDLAALLEAGVENGVASLGTAFTEAQARLLARYCTRVVFSYDGDAAGVSATARSLDLLLERGFEVRVVELPSGEDPDAFIRGHGPAAYRALLETAPEYLEFLIRRVARSSTDRPIEVKVAAVNAVLPHMAKLGNAVERGAWAARLGDALRIDCDLVIQELRAAVRAARPRIRQRGPAAAGRRAPRQAEARLVSLLLQSEEERRPWACGERDLAELEGTAVAPIVRAIAELARRGARVDYPAVHEVLDESDRELLTEIAFRDGADAGPSVDDCLAAFRRDRLQLELKRQARALGDSQAAAGNEVDRQLLRQLELAGQRDALGCGEHRET